MKTITLHEVIQYMDSPDENGKPNVFDIVFCTFSSTRQTGGERITMKNAHQLIGKSKTGEKIQIKPISENSIAKRNPNHWRNQTRNISIVGTGQIRKVHIRLIEFFNGKKVIW